MSKKNQRVGVAGFEPKYLFNNYFEEKKVIDYFLNLLNSHLVTRKPHAVFSAVCKVIGEKTMIPMLIKVYPEIIKEKNVGRNFLRYNNLEDSVPENIINSILRWEVMPLLAKRLEQLLPRRNNEIEKRLNILKETFNLSNDEIDVTTFYYLIDNNAVINEYLMDDDKIINLSTFSAFRSYGHILLGLKKRDIAKVFSSKRLADIGILEGYMTWRTRSRHTTTITRTSITDWCREYLSGIGKRELSHSFFSTGNDDALNLSDLDIPEDEKLVLDTLMKSKAGYNILFYGEPGTGKTTLAKCLAKEYGRELITVKIPESDKHDDRIAAVYASLNFANNGRHLILVDEADEMLNTHDSIFGRSKTSKSWINNLLESHDNKIIWCTNRFYNIHPSTMRRFSFTMEFKGFSSKNRLRVIKNELNSKGFSNYFNEEELMDICRSHSVNAGGIVNAVKILGIDRKTEKETALKKIKAVLRNHERAVTGKSSDNKRLKDFKCYSLKGLNCSENPEKIISAIKQYRGLQDAGKLEYSGAASLLLHGMPGTGKSEFVYYLGYTLGKEVLLKRCSEIQSMWVGQTEKNIAEAFNEAQKDKSILFFDEADSFLFPRKDASHSWEKNFTNEILTQLESYTGIVVFATNDIDGLDHASLRRFRFKIEFKPLTPEGNLHFYDTILAKTVSKNNQIYDDEISLIKNIKNLTPGDFAVVKDRYVFAADTEITHRHLIESLINEVRYKKGEKRFIGF